MRVGFKRLVDTAKLPLSTPGNVGSDLYSVVDLVIPAGYIRKVGTGIAIADYDPSVGGDNYGSPNERAAVADEWHGQLTMYPKIEGRSGLASKGIFPVGGIVDPTYRGEIIVMLYNSSQSDFSIDAGDRIAQLVFYPVVAAPRLEFYETDTLVLTSRGSNGFGSSGR